MAAGSGARRRSRIALRARFSQAHRPFSRCFWGGALTGNRGCAKRRPGRVGTGGVVAGCGGRGGGRGLAGGVAGAAAGAAHLEEVLEVAAEEARAAIGAASLSVSRWERDAAALRTIINVGDLGPGEERYPANEVHPLSEDRAAERLVLEGQPYFNSVDAQTIDEVSMRRLRRLAKE